MWEKESTAKELLLLQLMMREIAHWTQFYLKFWTLQQQKIEIFRFFIINIISICLRMT